MYSAAADTIAAVVDSVGVVSACVSALVIGVFGADDAAIVDTDLCWIAAFGLLLPLLVLLLFVALLYN